MAFLLWLHVSLTNPTQCPDIFSLLPSPCSVLPAHPCVLHSSPCQIATWFPLNSHLTSNTKVIFRIQASMYVGPWVEFQGVNTFLKKKVLKGLFPKLGFTYIIWPEVSVGFFPGEFIQLFLLSIIKHIVKSQVKPQCSSLHPFKTLWFTEQRLVPGKFWGIHQHRYFKVFFSIYPPSNYKPYKPIKGASDFSLRALFFCLWGNRPQFNR